MQKAYMDVQLQLRPFQNLSRSLMKHVLLMMPAPLSLLQVQPPGPSLSLKPWESGGKFHLLQKRKRTTNDGLLQNMVVNPFQIY